MLSLSANLQRLLVFSIMLICLRLVFCNLFSLFNLKTWERLKCLNFWLYYIICWTFVVTESLREHFFKIWTWWSLDGWAPEPQHQQQQQHQHEPTGTYRLRLEIINSIVWILSQILTHTVLNRIPPKGITRTHRSAPTIQWVAGDHPTTVDRLEQTLSVTHEELPKWPTDRVVWCCSGRISIQSLIITIVTSLMNVLGWLLRSAKDTFLVLQLLPMM